MFLSVFAGDVAARPRVPLLSSPESRCCKTPPVESADEAEAEMRPPVPLAAAVVALAAVVFMQSLAVTGFDG